LALAAQDKYTLKVPNGLAFSEFRGYENWQDVAVSQTENGIKVIVANPAMINAYRSGIPANGKHFPGLQGCEDRVDIEKESGIPLFRDGAGCPEIGFVHRKGYQAIPGHQRMGIRAVSL
jgi:hypothetical protein